MTAACQREAPRQARPGGASLVGPGVGSAAGELLFPLVGLDTSLAADLRELIRPMWTSFTGNAVTCGSEVSELSGAD
jgi:hypothetical protein